MVKELQYNNSMTNDNINYAFIAGAYEGMLSSLAYTLVNKGLVTNDPGTYDKLKEFISSEIDRVKQVERDYSLPLDQA